MKRYSNLYQNICEHDNILNSYNEVKRNTKSPRRVENLREYKAIYLARTYNTLVNKKVLKKTCCL